MPEFDGLDVCREVPEILGCFQSCFCRRRDDRSTGCLASEIGGDDYVTKARQPRELVARVNVILRRTTWRALDARQRRVSQGRLSVIPNSMLPRSRARRFA